ncbi:hypothetical protein EVAR_22094_1 [Eumeta japonica]|uniref:Uncharacterized protein n=1 Tax=Eumeta variegata TaxID=151549 RepID=A0A4C1USP2_EUMVA|nr:hypothetical protein EVAR_22094_1 [Eumeta japonica]
MNARNPIGVTNVLPASCVEMGYLMKRKVDRRRGKGAGHCDKRVVTFARTLAAAQYPRPQRRADEGRRPPTLI